jgi:O-antigen ligase
MILYNKNYISGKLLIFLIALMILTLIVSFFIDPGSNYNSYPYLIAFLILFFSRPNSKISIYLLGIIIYYSVMFDDQHFSSRAGYMLTFSLTCISLYILPYLTLKDISRNQINNSLIIICYSIIITYFFTSEVSTDISLSRVYFKGFIIPHQFVYLMAIFVHYFLLQKKYLLTVLPIIYSVYVGTRTGMILILLTLFAYFFLMFQAKYRKKILKFIFIFLLFIVTLFITENPIQKQITEVFQLLNPTSLLVDSESEESTNFTSNRNVLIIAGVTQIRLDGISPKNFFGRGPRSSYSFIERTLNWNIWFHNDLLEIIFSLGFLNLIIYLKLITSYCKKTKSKFFFFFIMISALTNGFFMYTSFVIIVVHYLTSHEKIRLSN